ncbi:hypothetical protein POTOM_023387 [Populus tomentosa]|uniref:Strictosidine synthase conserved region domain-containing protein n=1 Tax=Populus tomentosa TaxID=118781 RepID=A0A8X7ZQ62_POPTO|nr:hypothetical protein POTOM_023387 [Populus tomentosa]
MAWCLHRRGKTLLCGILLERTLMRRSTAYILLSYKVLRFWMRVPFGKIVLIRWKVVITRLLWTIFKVASGRFADEVIESSDGSLYFTVASTKFGFHDWYLDVLEAKPHGQLLKYDPSLNETSILLDGLCFSNGVALSREEDYLVFCETWKYRCLKYWLKGTEKGKTEIFIDNLPGGPDNIYLAPDGSFWIALLQVASNGLEFVHRSKLSKHLVASFPKLVNLASGVKRKATVVNVAADGKIKRKFDDPDGKVMSFVTTAFEIEDHLYLGSLNTNFIGKLPLNPTNS